jgi:hypothetical protein
MTNKKGELDSIKTYQTLALSLNKTLEPREWSALSTEYLSPAKFWQEKLNDS